MIELEEGAWERRKEARKIKRNELGEGGGVCMGVQEYDNFNVSSTTSDNPHYYKLFHNYP